MRSVAWTGVVVALFAGRVAAQSPQSVEPNVAIAAEQTARSWDAGADRWAPTVPPADRVPIEYHWHSGIAGHKRLLFEEPRLERQGVSRVAPLQLAQSAAAFFSRSLILPANFLLGRHRQPEP